MIILPYPDNRFRTIYADPPWPEYGGGKITRGAQKHYDLMRISEIVAMGSEVQRVAAHDSHLYLWVTNNKLPHGLEVMTAWGFRYITVITWVKERIGLGQYFRGLSEYCLFGARGFLPYRKRQDGKRAQGRTAFIERKREHSVKPETMIEMIELVSYKPRLELFARKTRPGWESWGSNIRQEE